MAGEIDTSRHRRLSDMADGDEGERGDIEGHGGGIGAA